MNKFAGAELSYLLEQKITNYYTKLQVDNGFFTKVDIINNYYTNIFYYH